MALDKKLYREAYELYRQWSDIKLVERARNAAKLSPAEAWQQYAALMEFAWKLCPEPSAWQRKKKLSDLSRYYARIQQFEAWRRERGQKP